MGKTSSKYKKKSRYSGLSTSSGSYYAPSDIGYVTKSVPSLSERTHDFSRGQEKSANLTMNYDNWLYGYSPDKFSSWCNGDFGARASTIQVPKATNVFATDASKVYSRSEKLNVRPRLITSLNDDRGSGNLPTYFLNRIRLH